ncbi:hypothetical protein WJX72_009827 [[Myrmecia] bisecta]|uniref:Tetrapyrrole biosynthesis uroporphyrinogen III synthase domain-containing protein n=1 Tax=[Myrmecia] bisecta TaxID=41462 RepID=A0AAW1R8G5_9CHLO
MDCRYWGKRHQQESLHRGKVQGGAPAAFATFKEAWTELCFSYVFEGCVDKLGMAEYGSAAARLAKATVSRVAAAADRVKESEVRQLATTHLTNTMAELAGLQHLQLLCNSYRKRKARVFGAGDVGEEPEAIADMELGEELHKLVSSTVESIKAILAGTFEPGRASGSRRRGVQPPNGSPAAADSGNPDPDYDPGADLDDPDLDLVEPDLEDLQLLDAAAADTAEELNSLPAAARRVLRKQAEEAAKVQRVRQQWLQRAAAVRQDMPSLPGLPPHPSSQRPAPARTTAPQAAQHVATAAVKASGTEVRPHGDPLAGSTDLPLLGKRIMITAPRQYAQKLSGRLMAAGARPIWVPAIQTTHLNDVKAIEALDAALQQLSSYTHLAFSSRNGVAAVMQRLAAIHGSQAAAVGAVLRSGVRCWALGADAEALHSVGVKDVFTPAKASTQGLVDELVARNEAAGARVLCPVPLVAGGLMEPPVVPQFLAALQAIGADAVRVDAYLTTLGCEPTAGVAEKRMLAQGDVAAIAFSSTAEAQGLVHMLGGAGVVRAAVEQHGLLLAAHGPTTAAGVSAVLGLPVPCINQNYSSFAGLVAALETALSPSYG